jgi:FKBP-type peptidyl-prolyl cis-trans isomerase
VPNGELGRLHIRGMIMQHPKPWALFLVLAVSMLACSSRQEGGSTDRFEHPNGLIVEVLEQGTGPAIEAGQTAVMHYTGWLDAGGWKKGEKFDSSHDRGRPFPVQNIGAGRVIQGWNQGIAPSGGFPGMRVGEQRRLLIPAELAYGARGAGHAIPPNANLIFDVELVQIR